MGTSTVKKTDGKFNIQKAILGMITLHDVIFF